MHRLDIRLFDSSLEDIPEIIGPYVRNYIQRHIRSRGGLGLDVSCQGQEIEFNVGDVGGVDFSAPGPVRMEAFMEVIIELDQVFPKDRLKEATLNLIAHAPREEVSYISAVNEPVVMADMSAQLPYLRALCFLGTPLHLAFPEPAPGMDGEIFPSLQHITLDRIFAPNGDWSRLITFLSRRASSGNQIITLDANIFFPHPDTWEEIRRAVRVFRMDGASES